MFPMTVTIHDKTQLNAVMNVLSIATEPHKAEVLTEKKPSPAPKAEKETKPAATQATAEATAAPAQKADNSEATETKAPTYQDAANAVTALHKAKGRDAAVAVLAEFGAAKLQDVKPEQFADVIAACEKASA